MTEHPNEMINLRKPLAEKVVRLGWILLCLGILVCVIGYFTDARLAALHNIVGYLFLMSLGLGAIFLIALDYVAGSVWSVPMRRVNEFLAALVFFAALLAIPVLFFLPEVFRWASVPSAVTDPILDSKRAYLNVNFFLLRFVVLSIIWIVFYYFMSRHSLRQDSTKDQKHTQWNIRLGAVFMPVFALGISVIAVDWSMSLEPHWYSTIFGVYYFSGTVIAALAAATYVIIKLHEHGFLQHLRSDHFYSLGTLLFVFINFWAYIAFSQFLLIWYANIPEETIWFITRWRNGWQAVSILLLLVQFWIPYFMLLTQESKTNLKRLKFMAVWLLVAHLLDLYWLVMPAYNSEVPLHWTMIGFPALSVGLIILVLAWNMKRKNIMPIGDPRLEQGLNFHL